MGTALREEKLKMVTASLGASFQGCGLDRALSEDSTVAVTEAATPKDLAGLCAPVDALASAVGSGLVELRADALLDACRVRRSEVCEGIRQLSHVLDETEADLQVLEDELVSKPLHDSTVLGNSQRTLEAYSGRMQWCLTMEAGLRRGAYALVVQECDVATSRENDEYATLFVDLADCRTRAQLLGARLRNARAFLSMPPLPMDVFEDMSAEDLALEVRDVETFMGRAALTCPLGHDMIEAQDDTLHAAYCGNCGARLRLAAVGDVFLRPFVCQSTGYTRCRRCTFAATLAPRVAVSAPRPGHGGRVLCGDAVFDGFKTLAGVLGVTDDAPSSAIEILLIPNFPTRFPTYV